MSRSFVVDSARRRCRVAVCALTWMLAVATASPQTIDERVVAALGPACQPVRETAIAAGRHKVMALFMSGPPLTEVDYGIYDIQSSAWSEGVVPVGIFDIVADPSIAYDPQNCHFVLAAAAVDVAPGLPQLVVARYKAEDCVTGNGRFLGWN